MSIVHLVAQTVKCLPTMRETRVWSLGGEATLAKEMTTHSSTLAWKILWIEEPGRLQSMGSQRIGHDWAISLSLSIYTSLGMLWDYHLFCRGSWMQMVSTPCMCMYISVWMGQFLWSHPSYTHTHTHTYTHSTSSSFSMLSLCLSVSQCICFFPEITLPHKLLQLPVHILTHLMYLTFPIHPSNQQNS